MRASYEITVEKFARVFAEQGVPGEFIKTIMADGHVETENKVTVDPETGKVDWIITNPDKEQYIISDETFQKKYEVDSENSDMFKPKGGPVIAAQISENLAFKAPW